MKNSNIIIEDFKRRKKKTFHYLLLTILRNVCIGLRKVSLNRLAGGFFGFELGVCTAQHLMKMPMIMMKMMPQSTQMYQKSVTHC